MASFGASFGWAIVGPGKIAHRFAEAVQRLPGAHLVVVQGRDIERGAAFAKVWSHHPHPPVRACQNLDDVLQAADVDAVYIATPHAFHFEAAERCLAAGKPVLCEKPLVPNEAQGRALVQLARRHNVFLMEAVWTRFLPIYAVVREWIRAGEIGSLRSLQSSFCFNVPFDASSRVFDPAQAGGALLDIGIYNLSISRWVLTAALGHCPPADSIQVSGVLAPSGVDQRVAALLQFPNGITSQFVCAVDGTASNGFFIFGEHGYIELPTRFWEATEAVLYRTGQEPLRQTRPLVINGFEGEIEETMRCIARDDIESPEMPHQETLATLSWMDQMRATLGVRYPFEN